MAVFDLFSKRKKQLLKAGNADVYRYDSIPKALRVQIAHIWRDAFGYYYAYNDDGVKDRWKFIHDAIAREKGVFNLGGDDNYETLCVGYLLGSPDIDDALDIIELSFKMVDRIISTVDEYRRKEQGIKLTAEDAIKELNIRFKENEVGYRYENGEIIRIDSQYVHAEVVKPALALLQGKQFEAANEEFMSAHRNYREGKNKDCVVACQRAFESTLKAICTLRKWKFEKGDRLPELIKTVRAKGLFPDYLDNGFDTYISMLKTGLPGVRNNAGGHGGGPNDAAVPSYIAGFALHTTATNIILAVEAYKSP